VKIKLERWVKATEREEMLGIVDTGKIHQKPHFDKSFLVT
jgi:hypothetical protein